MLSDIPVCCKYMYMYGSFYALVDGVWPEAYGSRAVCLCVCVCVCVSVCMSFAPVSLQWLKGTCKR